MDEVPAKVATKDPILVMLSPVRRPDAEVGGIKGFVPPWSIRHGSGKVIDCTDVRLFGPPQTITTIVPAALHTYL